MTTTDKLRLMDEIRARNDERIKAWNQSNPMPTGELTDLTEM